MSNVFGKFGQTLISLQLYAIYWIRAFSKINTAPVPLCARLILVSLDIEVRSTREKLLRWILWLICASRQLYYF